METNPRDQTAEAGETPRELGTEPAPARSLGPAPPGVVLGSLTVASLHEPWFVSLKKQIVELLGTQPPLPKYQGAPIRRGDEEARLALLNLRALHEPWFVSLKRQLKASRADKKLPPLKISSKPVRVNSKESARRRRCTSCWSLSYSLPPRRFR